MSSQPSRPRKVTVRPEPRISINKLGEYLIATASRRRQILRDQKRPPEFKTVRYEEAQRAIVDHLAHRDSDPEILSRHLSRLTNWSRGATDSDFDEQKHRDCRAAIEVFARLVGELDLGGLVMTPGRAPFPKLRKAGVEISVRPELLIQGIGRNGERFVGALKLQFSKSTVLDEKAAEYITTIIHEYVERHHAGAIACDPRRCFTLDVFAGALHSAPKNFIRRRSDVEAACEEIASRWDSV